MFQLLPPCTSNGLFRAFMRRMDNKEDKAASSNADRSGQDAWVREQDRAMSSLDCDWFTPWFTHFEPTVNPELTSMMSFIATADNAEVIGSSDDVAFTRPCLLQSYYMEPFCSKLLSQKGCFPIFPSVAFSNRLVSEGHSVVRSKSQVDWSGGLTDFVADFKGSNFS